MDLIGRDPGDIQEVIDQWHELANLTVNHFTSACHTRRRGVGLQSFECEPNRCERVSEFVRKRREEFVLTLVRFDELGGSVTHAQFQISIQGFSLVLRSPETLYEIVIVESQSERGFDHQMES